MLDWLLESKGYFGFHKDNCTTEQPKQNVVQDVKWCCYLSFLTLELLLCFALLHQGLPAISDGMFGSLHLMVLHRFSCVFKRLIVNKSSSLGAGAGKKKSVLLSKIVRDDWDFFCVEFVASSSSCLVTSPKLGPWM